MALDGWVGLHMAETIFGTYFIGMSWEFVWCCMEVLFLLSVSWLHVIGSGCMVLGIFWDSCFGIVLDGFFAGSTIYECTLMLFWWHCCSILFWFANETVFLFVFSVVCCCNHHAGAGSVLPSLAHQFCWALGICNFFAPLIMRLLTIATCVAMSTVSLCLSLHAGSLQTPQNL